MRHLPLLCRLAVALWVGGASLFTFVLTPAIFAAYDRDAAGAVVGILFPGYFRWGLACGAVALVCLLLTNLPRKKLALALVAAMLAATAFQAFVLEPRAAALKRDIPSFVTTPPEHPLRQEFRRLHGISSAANLGVIGGGVLLTLLL